MDDESYLVSIFTEMLNEKPYVSRVSQHLFVTLVHTDTKTFKAVVAGMDHLEQLPGAEAPRTKPATSFRGPILGSLSKFHYTTTKFLPQNVLLHWQSKGNRGVAKQAGDLFDKALASDTAPLDAWEIAGQIADDVVAGYGKRRDDHKLTGEWVIFRVWNGQKYFLSLGVHTELKDEQALFDRVHLECPEFPFCFLRNQTEKSE